MYNERGELGIETLGALPNVFKIPVNGYTEKGDSGQYILNPETFAPVRAKVTIGPQKKRYPDAVHARLSDTPGLSVNLSGDQGGVQKDGSRYVLKWESKGISHGRHAPKIIPDGPLSKLVVLKLY